MHERKSRMYDHADAYGLTGGFGTLEELAEVLTWNQIGLLAKPVGVLDAAASAAAPSPPRHHGRQDDPEGAEPGLLLDDSDPGSLLGRLEATTIVHEPKWIGEELT